MTTAAVGVGIEIPERSVLVGGRWLSPSGATLLDVVEPATEQVLAQVVDTPPDVAAAALAAARAALDDWSGRPVAERAALLDALAAAFERHGDQLAVLASREIGMPLRESRVVQVDLPAKVLRVTADIARDFAWEFRDASGSTVVREPVGVVLAITPWNFPVHQIVAKLAPALAAGCTVVVKPAELTPLNALFVGRLCEAAGIPPGVVNVVTGRGATTGESLVQSPGWDLVSFTGSLAVGRHIGAVAGGRVLRATLELGGKSPAVVLDDADLETAVRTTVRNCFVNAGQKCNAPTRLIVPVERLTEAVTVAAAAAEGYVLGDPLDDRTTMGPLVSDVQRRRVLEHLDRARREGARVVTGGTDGGHEVGWFVTPAIVADAAPDSAIVREEVFGPVLVVLGHTGEDDAVRQANDTPYGLSAEVWSGDERRAAALARRVRAGQVRVNGVRTPALPVSPFGGYKASGLGREMGPFALEEYLEVKAILGDPVLDSGRDDEPAAAPAREGR